ncbi:hypothetical protein C7M84_025258 [Penaeus vannamei]|uniref:Uncharacterized protein n=1 Tax=Penaeus vannamei TaxID=6689 RepID=A0A3R7PST6_PENVA|nr:hypothetical protein C7M84_025258 [Penaeus vannamei]
MLSASCFLFPPPSLSSVFDQCSLPTALRFVTRQPCACLVCLFFFISVSQTLSVFVSYHWDIVDSPFSHPFQALSSLPIPIDLVIPVFPAAFTSVLCLFIYSSNVALSASLTHISFPGPLPHPLTSLGFIRPLSEVILALPFGRVSCTIVADPKQGYWQFAVPFFTYASSGLARLECLFFFFPRLRNCFSTRFRGDTLVPSHAFTYHAHLNLCSLYDCHTRGHVSQSFECDRLPVSNPAPPTVNPRANIPFPLALLSTVVFYFSRGPLLPLLPPGDSLQPPSSLHARPPPVSPQRKDIEACGDNSVAAQQSSHNHLLTSTLFSPTAQPSASPGTHHVISISPLLTFGSGNSTHTFLSTSCRVLVVRPLSLRSGVAYVTSRVSGRCHPPRFRFSVGANTYTI